LLKKTKIKLSLIIFLLFFIKSISYSQLSIDTTICPSNLVKILLGKETTLKIENVKYKGAKQSIGLFNNRYVKKIISKGIILCTGNVFGSIGPNDSPSKGHKNFTAGDSKLGKIANGKTFDAAILEFDLISLTDSISFISSKQRYSSIYYDINCFFFTPVTAVILNSDSNFFLS